MSRDEGAGEPGFEQFERFLEEWSRRDFLRRMGMSAAWVAFSAGALELLEACGGGGTNTRSVNPVKGDNVTTLASGLPQISSDSLTFTFKLRSNLQWSDGQPLTADDVAFTYNLIFSPDTKDFISRYRANLEGYVKSVTATDPKTVVFQFNKVLANFVDTHCRYGILPKHVLGYVAPKALNTHSYFTRPTLATAAFQFE